MHTQIQKAFQLIEKNQRDEATKIFEEISSIRTDDIEEIVWRGRLALQLDENIYAIRSFSRAIELQPANVDCIYLLSNAYAKTGNLPHAAELSKKAVEINPDRYEPYIILGKQAESTGEFLDAVTFYEKAIKLKPSDPASYSGLILCLRILDRHEEALSYAKKFLRIENSATSHISISRVLIELGRTEEATSYLEKAIRIDSACGYAYQELATIKKFSDEDNQWIEKTEKALQLSMPAVQRSLIHFSLGKIYNDIKEWDKAFEHYKQANLLLKEPAEPKWLLNRYKHVKKVYNKSFIKKFAHCGSDSEIPVFIIGMPRTGTTLIEQIIASHPEGEGAGELTEIGRIHSRICPSEKTSTKDLERNLNKEDLASYANEYLKVLRSTRENASRIVDKLPDNFAYLGLIYTLFPNAHFIHTMRNPLDTCMSCYFQPFAYVPETSDQGWLSKRYRFYRETMDHWKRLLPDAKILEVQYEQLIQDFETESHRIIEFCGLSWDPQCLEFYKAPRSIVTASVWQARQPIYSSSRRRWINYAQHLGELANQISDYLDEEDIAELERQGVKLSKKWGMGFLKRAKN